MTMSFFQAIGIAHYIIGIIVMTLHLINVSLKKPFYRHLQLLMYSIVSHLSPFVAVNLTIIGELTDLAPFHARCMEVQ